MMDVTDFNKFLDAHIDGIEGRYSAPDEAQQFYSWMQENHPDVLKAWVLDRALRTITEEIARRSRSDRAKARRRAKPRAFQEAMSEAAASGATEPLEAFISVYDAEYAVDDRNTRARARDMTGAEHRFVAKGYRASERQAAMVAAFHEAVAKKVGRRRTFEVLSQEQYESMYQSIAGRAA